MAKTQKQELAVIDFTQFSVAQLPELKGKKEEIASVIEANPIVEIVDNATYESAKKSRTAVRTLRTSLESEQKTVKKRIKENVLDVVDKEYDMLIAGVRNYENKRQVKVDDWEDKKKKESEEKARLEQERIDGIKTKISDYVASWKDAFGLMTFEKIQEVSDNFHESNNTFDKISLQEFDVLFDREISTLCELLDSKISTLKEQEQIRIDNLLIQEKNAEQTSIQEWQRTWNANIDTLSVSDVADVKSILVKSKLANLKHYVSGYEEIYLSTEKRLHSQIEFVSKAEEQRIAQEKLDQEKKEFEEKQAEAKFEERCKQLSDLGFVLNEGIDAYQKGLHYFNLEDIRNSSDDLWLRELEDAKNVKDFSELETVDASVNQNYHEEDVDAKGIIVNDPIIFDAIENVSGVKYVDLTNVLPPNTTDKIDEIANNDAFIQTEEFDHTWEGINKLFEKIHYSDSGFSNNEDAVEMRKLIFEYLEKHFNVPTLKK